MFEGQSKYYRNIGAIHWMVVGGVESLMLGTWDSSFVAGLSFLQVNWLYLCAVSHTYYSSVCWLSSSWLSVWITCLSAMLSARFQSFPQETTRRNHVFTVHNVHSVKIASTYYFLVFIVSWYLSWPCHPVLALLTFLNNTWNLSCGVWVAKASSHF